MNKKTIIILIVVFSLILISGGVVIVVYFYSSNNKSKNNNCSGNGIYIKNTDSCFCKNRYSGSDCSVLIDYLIPKNIEIYKNLIPYSGYEGVDNVLIFSNQEVQQKNKIFIQKVGKNRKGDTTYRFTNQNDNKYYLQYHPELESGVWLIGVGEFNSTKKELIFTVKEISNTEFTIVPKQVIDNSILVKSSSDNSIFVIDRLSTTPTLWNNYQINKQLIIKFPKKCLPK